MAKNLESKMMPDMRDSTKPSTLPHEMEEDYHTPTTKEIMDTRPTVAEDNTTETKDALPLLKAETTWMSMP